MRITNEAQINQATMRANCSPRFECIIGQTYIGDIWAYSSSKHGTCYGVSVYAQFVGTMHAGTDHETVWEEPTCGFIEDGNARKGELISSAFFDDFSEALDHLVGESKRLMTGIFGGLDAQSLAV